MDKRTDRFKGCLMGLACGDAVGTTVEFRPRGSFDPVTDMTGGGPFGLEPGQWTDDTSMALCLAESLLECGGFDARDQAERYVRWRDQGHMSSNGFCFDIGGTVSNALFRFSLTGEVFSGSNDPLSAGNGCIMRLAPVPMFFASDRAQAVEMSAQSSRTTHGAAECLDACRLFASILVSALEGRGKEDVLFGHGDLGLASPAIASIAAGDYDGKDEAEIRGSGYVVESLEAALWCFFQTESFCDAVLLAANLGHDADTTAAICGQVAGAFYGVSEIPAGWLDKLAMRDLIEDFALRLMPRD